MCQLFHRLQWYAGSDRVKILSKCKFSDEDDYRTVVPNLFCSMGPFILFWRAWGHKVIFAFPSIPFSPFPPTARGSGRALEASPAGSGTELQPTTHCRAFYGKGWLFDMLREIFQHSKKQEIFRFSQKFVIFTITGIAAHTLPAYPVKMGSFTVFAHVF